MAVLASLLVSTTLAPNVSYAQSSGSDVPVDEDAPAMVQDSGQPTPPLEPTVEPVPTGDAVAPAVGPVASPPLVPLVPSAPFVKATVVSTKTAATPIRLFPSAAGGWPVSGPTDASVKAINNIASPVDAPLFTSMYHLASRPLFELRLAKADDATFSYSCATGMCTGSAEDVWKAMPDQQRLDYLSTLLAAARDNQNWGARAAFQVGVRVEPGAGPMLGCAQTQPGLMVVSVSVAACQN